MYLRVITWIVFVAAISGCATPQIALTKQAQTSIDRVEGILIIPQEKLDVTVHTTNPGNTGLLGALIAVSIDSVRQSNAEKSASPLFEELSKYDFRSVMLDASTDELSNIDKIKFDIPLLVEEDLSDSAKSAAFKQSSADAILFCHVYYQLESGNLIVTANAEMYPKADKLKEFRNQPEETDPLDGGNVIYRNTFTRLKHAVTRSTIKESLTEAATNIAHQLAVDLNRGI